MRLLSLLVTTGLLLSVDAGVLRPKGPPCPRGDGLYAVGCSNKYLECVNNVEFERSCPDGLYFDRLLARCERKMNTGSCKNAGDSRKIDIPVRQKAVSINCEGRKDGDYALDKDICSQNYYQCANGRSFMRKCSYNLVFSTYSRDCTYEQDCHGIDMVKNRPAAAYADPTYDADKYVVTAFEEEEGQGPPGINCATQGDSLISHLNCSAYFWQCSQGKLIRKSCPPGLIYVLSQNLCDYPQGVKGCPEYDGSAPSYQQTEPPRRPTPTTTTRGYEAPYTEATTTPAYVPPYVAPTTTPVPASEQPATQPTFYIRRVTTPAYVPPTTTTLPPAYVPPATTTSAPVYAPYASAPASPVVHDAEEAKILARCNGKADSFYEISSCHEKFLVCSNGGGRIIACANDLVYDSRTNACDYLEVCKAPRKQEDVPKLYNHGGAFDKKAEEVKVDFDCSEKEDGTYTKEACVNNYFQCQDRRAFALKCPADLVYNLASKICDHAHNCEKHYMEPTRLYGNQAEETQKDSQEEYTTVAATEAPYTTTAPVYSQPPTRPVYNQQPTTTKAYTTTTAAPYTTATPAVATDNFSCSGRVDGNYASGICKTVFYTCSYGQLHAMKCAATLKYNPYNGQCDYELNIVDCRSPDQPQILPMPTDTPYVQPTTTAAPTTAAAPTTTTAPVYNAPVETTKAPVYAPVHSYPTTQPPKYAAYCERLADGNYGKPCQRDFIQCANFETTVITCPAGLFYSLLRDRCDYAVNVEGCPGYVSTTTPAQDETTAAPYATKTYPNIDYTTAVPGPVDTTPIAETFNCYGRADGIYALPYCTRDYVQCMTGRSLISSCALGLFYNERDGLCDYKENVPVCRLRKGADSIVDDACLGKPDGYYSAGCSSNYFSCTGERTRKMVCPNQLKFSEKTGLCGYASEVKECGIATPIGNAPPAVPSDFCTIRPAGLHAFGQCSSHYVVCQNAIAIAGTCASPLVFNEESQLCDWKRNNKECGADYVARTEAVKGYYETSKATESYVYVPTTTAKPYYPPTTTTPTTTPASDEPETTTTTTAAPYTTTTTEAYTQPSTTTTTAAPYTTTTEETTTTTTGAPYTTTQAYTQPTTTTEAYTTTTVAPTTTTTEAYTQPTTTTEAPASDEPTTVPVTTTQEYTQTPVYTTAQPY